MLTSSYMDAAHDSQTARLTRTLAELAQRLASTDDADVRLQDALAILAELVPCAACTLRETDAGRAWTRSTGVGDREGGLALPVRALDRVIGVLHVEPRAGHPFGEHEQQLLELVAAQLGTFLTLVRLRDLQRMVVSVIERELRSPLAGMSTAISHLLDVSDLYTGGRLAIDRQRLDLRALVDQAADHARVRHPGIHLAVTGAGIAPADGDAARLAQALANLLDHAAVHHRRSAPIELRLTVERDEVMVAVHHDGPAIPAELVPSVFEGGEQDLGLHVVDQIARGHGGRVVLRSAEDSGTTFTLRFPRWVDGANAPAADPRETDDGAMVMVVDDDPDVRESICDLLEDHGFTVVAASNGEEALQLIRDGQRPRLLLLDLWMPVMDGETLYTALHDDPAFASIPVCVIAADASRADELTRSGAGFLRKPVQVPELLRRLEQVAA